MESIKSLLSYFFAQTPGTNFKFYMPLIILVAILIVGSIVFSIIYKKQKKHDFAFKRLFKKTGTRMLLLGLLFGLLLIFRYENIPYFSMRIWLYLSLLALVYFIYKTIRVYKVDYPREKEKTKRNPITKEEIKYLPHKKKRK